MLAASRIAGLGVMFHPSDGWAFCKGWPRCEQPPGSLGWALCCIQRTVGLSVKAGLTTSPMICKSSSRSFAVYLLVHCRQALLHCCYGGC